MGKIDTSEWKEFRIGDYFKVEYGRFHAKDELGTGTVNYITTSGFNNGITNTCEEATHQGNCITVASDGAMGASFYQEEAFTTSNIVSTLTPLPHTPLNKYNALFLCAIIFGKRAEFGWLGFKMSVDRVRNLRVKLPTTPDGAPDWAYMESYMANLETKVAESLTLLQTAKDAEKKKVDTREWGEFRVGELFEVKISKSVDKGGLEFAEDGEYDFIGRTPLNNGIQGRLNKLKFEANQEGTYSIAQIGMHVCQYRERKWYASQNIFVLTPFAEKSHKANKFIATIITRYLDCAYGEDTYATYPTAKTLPHLKIKLPVDKTGQPDWRYMEEYMRKVEERVKATMGKYEMAVNEVAL